MKSIQQKQKENEDQFETINDQIESQQLPSPNHNTTPNSKYHPRLKNISQKHKLGLLLTPSTAQSLYSIDHSKSIDITCSKIIKIGSVTFRANFESGNIGDVEMVGANQFKIMLNQESNSSRVNSWFYFAVQGIKGQAKFSIYGFTKKNSLYNKGMKICFKDGKDSMKWRRGGTHIQYEQVPQGEQQLGKYRLTFSYFFKNASSTSVQFAYSFPYGYTKLQTLITQLHSKIKVHSLGKTHDGKNIPILIIGNVKSKEIIVISARVHPGQTGSSFIMQGFIKEILSDNEHAAYLRATYLFKIVPMINIDGVIRGNFRFSAPGLDLNRKWQQPLQNHHPQIYYLKDMMQKQKQQRKIIMYIDLHGHSRKKNVFFYGCCRGSQQQNDFTKAKAFPYLMSRIHEAFSYQDCCFNVQRDKEGTARVTMWKQLKINQIYTLQASFCGSEKGGNYLQLDYEKIGRKLCEGIATYFYSPTKSESNQMSNLSAFRQKIFNQLSNDPSLLRTGSNEDTGSDSEPEKGQILIKPSNPVSKEGIKKYQAKMTPNMRHLPKSVSSKQKSQAAIWQDHQLIKQKQMFEYLFQYPSETSTVQKKTQLVIGFRNTRMHSFSRNNSKHSKFNEEGQQTRNADKNKANLLVGWEGAQYRRVRKIAQKNWRRQASTGDIEVKQLKVNHLSIDNHRIMMPKHMLNPQQSKTRNLSAQMFFKKTNKTEDRSFLSYNQSNVQCRGRQIFF